MEVLHAHRKRYIVVEWVILTGDARHHGRKRPFCPECELMLPPHNKLDSNPSHSRAVSIHWLCAFPPAKKVQNVDMQKDTRGGKITGSVPELGPAVDLHRGHAGLGKALLLLGVPS
jgi:hypothetical protein